MSMLGVAMTALTVAGASPAVGRAVPDAHMIRSPRGDVLVVAPLGTTYVPPYRGWRYTPRRAGQRLAPVFQVTRYIVVDPGRYGLPAAAPNRWIRYGDDLLLVDATGRVLRVARNRLNRLPPPSR